ncbi:MAG TPA: protein kinase [Kofleriaceae bacterium]|nr:protein kinase [Kofleriaceae bacterium]
MNEQSVLAPIEHPQLTVGRYVLHRQIARGGMATIHIARLMGDEGFSRIVAAKRLLPEFAEDSEFVAMFLDEARIASKVHHRNVVPVLDVVTAMDEVVLVQEYVHGAPLHWLLNRARQSNQHVPVNVSVAIAAQVLSGLHAAHELVDELGVPLNVVHRDVSPQNVMIGTDGAARLLDFGVAKATMAAHVTREGTYKGKLAYSAPEQMRGAATKQSDIYSLGIVLWEMLVGHRMHSAQTESELVAAVMSGSLPSLIDSLAKQNEWRSIDAQTWKQIAALEPIVKRALLLDSVKRWTTAAEMEDALCAAVRPASSSMVAAWLKTVGKDYLDKHDRVLAAEETSWRRSALASSRRPQDGARDTRPDEPQPQPQPAPRPRSTPPRERRAAPQALIALLSVLVIALAIGIVIVVRKPTPALQASPLKHADAELAPTSPLPSATPAPELPAPPRVVGRRDATTPTFEPPPLPADLERKDRGDDKKIAIGRAETRPSNPPSPPTRKPPAKQSQQTQQNRQPPPPRKASTPDKPAPSKPAVTETPQPQNTVNCTPPYYFEGSKKIFKPACL